MPRSVARSVEQVPSGVPLCPQGAGLGSPPPRCARRTGLPFGLPRGRACPSRGSFAGPEPCPTRPRPGGAPIGVLRGAVRPALPPPAPRSVPRGPGPGGRPSELGRVPDSSATPSFVGAGPSEAVEVPPARRRRAARASVRPGSLGRVRIRTLGTSPPLFGLAWGRSGALGGVRRRAGLCRGAVRPGQASRPLDEPDGRLVRGAQRLTRALAGAKRDLSGFEPGSSSLQVWSSNH